jgi:hypothetical protein
MRLGKLKFEVAYVVDLDDEDMVERAKQVLAQDVIDMVHLNGGRAIKNSLVQIEEPEATVDDIEACLFEDEPYDEAAYG